MTAPDMTLLQSIPQGSTPVPDPTALTAAAVKGAVEQLRLDIAAQHDLFGTRQDATDQAVTRQLDHLRDLLNVMLGDAAILNASERAVLVARLDGVDRLLDERHATQTMALAAAVESQQTAMRTALAAADTAVTAALTAAEKAVDKAEKAAEKRFDCVAVGTPVALADGTTAVAGQLRAGDAITDIDGHTTVVSNYVDTEELFEVATPDGSVLCTSTHPWYARPDINSQYEWVETRHLAAGWLVWRTADADRK